MFTGKNATCHISCQRSVMCSVFPHLNSMLCTEFSAENLTFMCSTEEHSSLPKTSSNIQFPFYMEHCATIFDNHDQCCGSRSGRIHIILADTDLFKPKVKQNYGTAVNKSQQMISYFSHTCKIWARKPHPDLHQKSGPDPNYHPNDPDPQH